MSECYSHMLERVMNNPIQSVTWSKSMDVCAILFTNNTLEVSRVGEQLQRMFVVTEEQPISTIQLETLYLFYCAANSLSIYQLASHQRILHIVLNRVEEPIISMALKEVSYPVIQHDLLIPKIVPLPNTSMKNWQILSFLRSEQQNNLVAVVQKSSVSVHINGFFPLVDIPEIDVLGTYFHENTIHLFKRDSVRVFDLPAVSIRVPYLNELLVFVKNSIVAVNAQLSEVYKVYNLNILNQLRGLKHDPVNSVILQFLLVGTCPKELSDYFRTELYNTKILQKMDEKITTHMNTIQDILQDSLMNVITLIYVELSMMGNTELKIQIKKLHDKLKDFQKECHETKINLRHFFVWLNKCALKYQDLESECENLTSPLNKIDQDLHKVYLFLKDERYFTLKNVKCLFNDHITMSPQPQPAVQQQENDPRVAIILKHIFKSRYQEIPKDQIIDEEPSQNITQIVREITRLHEELMSKPQPRFVREIKFIHSIERLSFAQKSYKFTIIGEKCLEYAYKLFAFEVVAEYPRANEVEYYNDEPIFRIDNVIKSADESRLSSIQCSEMSNLSVSRRGLLSLIVDKNKLLI